MASSRTGYATFPALPTRWWSADPALHAIVGPTALQLTAFARSRRAIEAIRSGVDIDFNLHQRQVLASANLYGEFYEANEEMHRMICCQGASLGFWHVANSAKAQLDRVRRLAMPRPGHLEGILEEHRAIADGPRRCDPDTAEAAMKFHPTRLFETVRKLTAAHSGYFDTEASTMLEQYVDMDKWPALEPTTT